MQPRNAPPRRQGAAANPEPASRPPATPASASPAPLPRPRHKNPERRRTADVRQQIDLTGAAREDSLKRAKLARQAGHEAQAGAAEDLTRRLEAHHERLQVADAARREWEEATGAKAEAARRARTELERRGPARPEGQQPQAGDAREVQAGEPAAAPDPAAQTQPAADTGEPRPGQEISHSPDAEADTGAWPEARDELAADVDPEALTVMAAADADMTAAARSEFDDNLARAQAGAEQLAEQRAHAQAERDQAAINEPAVQAEAEAQAALDAANPGRDAEADDISPKI